MNNEGPRHRLSPTTTHKSTTDSAELATAEKLLAKTGRYFLRAEKTTTESPN